jgi:uncharacterized Zn-binding protein involved in type VI secretion
VPSVAVNPPKTPITKGSNGIAAATVPNVCKMPGPPAPFVPTPLPNIGRSGDSPKGYSTSVKIEGQAVAIQGASFGSTGDIASKGTGGGLLSSNTHGPTKFIAPGSLDVKIEGKNVQLLGDQMLNNCGPSGSPPNAATMMGAAQSPTEAIDVTKNCAHCGKSLDDASHVGIKTDDKKQIAKALEAPSPSTAQTVGATKGAGRQVTGFSGGGDGKLFNLATNKAIPISKAQADLFAAMGNELGNCCEQKMLRDIFIGPGKPAFPPADGIGSIKMGVTARIGGRPSAKEKAAAKPKAPCGTCENALVAMLCTNESVEKKGKGN